MSLELAQPLLFHDLMNLRELSHEDLLTQFGLLVRTERKITARVLEYVAEIDRRKIYLDRAHSSLFDFLVGEIGYSPGAAMRRISAARLLAEIPDVSERVNSGTLNLSQLSQVDQAIRTVKKDTGVAMTTAGKIDLLNRVAGSTQRQTEAIIAGSLEIPVAPPSRTVRHWDESVTLTMTFNKNQMARLERTKNLVAHAVPDGKWASMVSYLSERELKRRAKSPLAAEHASCQFKDPKTGRVCGAKVFLQVEHIQPRWAGGGDEPENLTVFCAAHNRHQYRMQAGMTYG